MPVCRNCEAMKASSEMRRSTTPGLWVCRDKDACKRRVKERTAEQLRLPKEEQ